MTYYVVDAERATQLVFSLLTEKPWLKDAGVWAHPLRPPHTESQAMRFLSQMRSGDAGGWGDCEPAVRKTVSTFLIDFLFKLRQPERFLSQTSWRVLEDEVPWRQAMTIVEHEIAHGLPQVWQTSSSLDDDEEEDEAA